MNEQERAIWWEYFSEKVIMIFGKNTFTEDELTKEFYTELYIGCNEFFRTEEGLVNLDWFWHEELREWLLTKK